MQHRLLFRMHAIRRMFERGITVDEVEAVLGAGEVIEDYPNDTPYPSRLMLGWIGSRPLHVVAASNLAQNEEIVITVYEPDLLQWVPGFKIRRVQ